LIERLTGSAETSVEYRSEDERVPSEVCGKNLLG